ncbi:hypothetical protein [Marinilactibacillus psychrotolerans]|uniref:DUF456 domain-containing protein n=1 Tax=Marinilactibacillus psychrotolerans TaxID=191770 RepID=A0ABW8UGN9_9LACT
MKKYGILFLMTLILSPIFTPSTIVMAEENRKSEITSVASDDGSQLEVIGYNEFLIQEGDKKYVQEFFVEANVVRIDDDYYNLDDYMNSLNNETYSITEALESLTPIELELTPSQQENTTTLESKVLTKNGNNSYSIMANSTLPKSGYGKETKVATRKKTNMLITATAAAGAALIAFLFPGAGTAVGIAFAKTVLAKAAAAGVISHATQAVTSTVYNDIYQAIHKTKIGAVKKRKNHLLKYKTEKSMVILALLISGQLDHTSMGG